ncbi:MAG: alpha-2-macroglobulin family protein [Bacteroidota bacterium]|nr:alpha-2-macroglobulin family protein [Bacteroidota bacterium]
MHDFLHLNHVYLLVKNPATTPTMRIAKICLAVCFTLFLSACSNKNKVNLTDTNAKDEVPSLGNFRFTFDKNLTPDSLLNRWDATEYVKFDPPIPGRFRWESSNELVFSPERSLPPATSYKAKVTDKVLQNAKKYSLGKCEVPLFHTPFVMLDNATAMWNVNESNSSAAFPQIDLYFNYPIAPSKLKQVLSIDINGSKKDFNIQTIAPDNKISITLLNMKMDDKDLLAKVKIGKGLVPEGGNNPTDKEIETSLTITSPFNLTVSNVEANHDGTQGTIKVYTSQQPIADNINSFISFDGKVKFKTVVSNDGFSIISEDFDVAKTYTLKLKAGLKGRIGGTLKEEYTNTLGFGKLEPRISFINKKGVYLSNKGAKNIEVMITSIKKVKVIISKIYENNLLAAQRNGYYPNTNNYHNYHSEESEGEEDGEREGYTGDYNYDYSYGSTTVGDVIYEKEIDTKSLPRNGNNRLFKFDLEDKLQDFKGIYHITIQSDEQYYLRDSRFISFSDIGLIAKEGKDKIIVFANSIQTAEALSGVSVTVIGNNNQKVGTATTDGNGIAEITLKNRDYAGFRSAMITAKMGTDFNYLPFSSTRVETSRFGVGGKRPNPSGLDAFVYSERDIYRPGEKVNFSVIIRDWKWKSPGEIPLKMKFLLPNGKDLKTLKKGLNDEGSLETQIELSPSAITGSYTFEVFTSNDVLLASKNIQVEEFMPDRIKVASEIDKKFLRPGETGTLSIDATNFFGPPAADRNYQVEIQLSEKYFSSGKYYKYNFSQSDRNNNYEKIEDEGKTDEKGHATEAYTVPMEYADRGIIEANFFTTVFDETGRPVSRESSIDIYTQDVFYGVGNGDYYYHPLNHNIVFPLIALDKDLKPVSTKAHVQVIKHEYYTAFAKYGEYFRYESRVDDKTIVDQQVDITGESTVFNFIPRTPGQYEIRVAKPGVNSYVHNEFYSYGWYGGYSNSNFEVNNEGNVDIELDKKSYMAGDNAKVLFKTPFNGKMLVTVENDHVIEYQYVNVENRAASVTLNLKEDYLPNAYVTATLIKPNEESDMPLTVAHGFKSLKVEEKGRNMDVQIFAEKNVRSRTHQKVHIKAAPNSKVTLAAVDEGILQITHYATPDPYNLFYANRALLVNSFDLYPLLFPDIKGTISSTGGDAAGNAKRANPLQNKRVKLVSYWSGIGEANASGDVNFEFDVPQFSGELRLMAVAYKGQSMGSKDAEMIVADPLVVSTALPRFLSPKDTVIMPVTITNTTKNATSATATVRLSGPLKIVGESSQTVNIKAKSEQRVRFRVVADPRIDVAKVTVEVNGLGEKFVDETDITVRPPASLQKVTGSGSIAAGGNQKIDFSLTKFIPSSADYQLIVSKNPALQVADQMWSLVEYPYGCTEQTVSAAFPQLYFSDMAELMNMNKSVKLNANYNVQEAIRKIKMRQLYNGAITLWDNEASENWWATVYAAHFLQEAQKAGFDVDKSLLDNIHTYLINRLKTRETEPYYYNRNLVKQIAPKEVCYSLYVLALAGKPQVSAMNYYKENSSLLSLDCKYLLSAAFAMAGDKSKFKELLPSSFAGEVSVRVTGGSFYSEIRDEGIALNAILDVDPQNAQVGIMAKHLSQEVKQSYWLSTQERAFAFLALGKIARQANKTNITASIKVNGKEIAKNDGSMLKLTSKQLSGTNVEITPTGTGVLYYFWQAEGISADGSFKEEDSYIKVRKRFYDRYGRQITGNNFKQNDIIIVALTLENSYNNKEVSNIVITDMLPAGFEIENPRTKEIPGMDWIKNESSPTQLDIRDDRINLFVDLGREPETYYYAVRAVSPGSYIMGPVMADAMYNGEYHSYNGGGVVRITEK